LPTSIKNAKELDRDNGNTLWADALQKEMSAVMVAFEVQPEETKFIPGYKRIPGHLVWDVKMDFTRKARYVAGGHRTDPPKALTYSSVVSRESVRIAMYGIILDMGLPGIYLINKYLIASEVQNPIRGALLVD
jgi:hypothetical protein